MSTPNALCISTLSPYDDLSINGLQSTNLAPYVREMARDRDDFPVKILMTFALRRTGCRSWSVKTDAIMMAGRLIGCDQETRSEPDSGTGS
jgi:hypothetical protein